MIAIVMGVSGSGKTTVALELTKLAGWQFAEGDDFHTEEAKAKMHAGIALTDEDRAPWLAKLHQVILGWYQANTNGVLTCSALKQAYRDTLVKDLPSGACRFVFVDAPYEIIEERLRARKGHYMGPQLLTSQFATLEAPTDALKVDAREEPQILAKKILAALQPGA